MHSDVTISAEGLWYISRNGINLHSIRLDWSPPAGEQARSRMPQSRLELMLLQTRLQYALDVITRILDEW